MPSSDQPKRKTTNAGADADTASGRGSSSSQDIRAGIGSGLLARQPTPEADEHVTVNKVCPHCGAEYETGDRFCPKDGAPLKPKTGADPMIGRVIADRYLILARLGEGGMGRVYAAEHVKMNRQCAIKVMNPSLMNDAESTTRFAREASNAARILHPNVAAVFDFGESEKTVYLVMEYVDGESLSELMAREGALAPRRAIDIARQIADGLSAAHELGLIHRDLKPDNVLITRKRDGREIAKVVDFGIAKAVSDSREDALTRSGLVIGTPEFMSPEQLLGDPVDARTDIYALGCILYQMLSGTKPFDAETREQMIRRRLHEAPPHVRETVPSVPKRVDTLIAHMLARSTSERLASAAEVSSSLDPALVMSGWELDSPSSVQMSIRSGRGAPTVMREVADPSMQPTMVMRINRPSAGRIALGTLVGSMALFGGLFMWHQRAETTLDAEATRTPAIAHTRTNSAKPTAPATVVQAPKDTAQVLTKRIAADSPRRTPVVRTPTKKAVASVDTSSKVTAKTAAAPAPGNADEEAIHETLDRFATAMGNGEVSIMNAFPGMPRMLLGNVKQIFVNAEKVSASAQQGQPTITGDRAEVSFTVLFKYQRRNSPVDETVPQRYDATLRRNGGRWELTGLTQRQ